MIRNLPAFSAAAVLVFACQAGNDGGVLAPAAPEAFELHHPDEIAPLRTATSWTRALPDGKRQAHVSTAPIHYSDDSGTLRRIDTNIVPVARRDLPNAAFGVEKNTFKTYFPARAGEGVTVELAGGHTIEMWKGTAIEVLSASLQPMDSREGSPAEGTIFENSVRYRSSFRHATDVFRVTTGRLKHELVLESRRALDGLPAGAWVALVEDVELGERLELTCGSDLLGAKALCERDIHVRDADGRSIAHFPRPTFWDATVDPKTAVPRGNGVFEVSSAAGAVRIKTLIPAAWVTDASRVFPVTFDPTLDQGSGADSDVLEPYPTTNNSSWWNMFVGFDDGSGYGYGYGRNRGFVKADLSAIPTYSIVNSASFKAYVFDGYLDYSTVNYNVGRVQSAWTESGITWNNQPGIDAPESTTAMAWGVVNWVSWSVPVMAQNWVSDPSQNHGLAIRTENEGSTYSLRVFYTKENGSNAPYFSVTYTPDSTAPVFQSTAVTGARYQNGNDYWIRGGEQVKINVRHLDSQSGVKIQQVDLYNGACNSWIDHYWDTHTNVLNYVPGGCNAVTWPAPTAEEIENAGGYTTTRFTAQFTSGDGDYPVQGRAWDYATNDSNLGNDGKYVKTDDSDPAVANLSPSGGSVSGTVSVSADVTDARSGVKSVVFSIGDAACSGGWSDLGAPTQNGNTFTSSWDTSGRPEGTYCIRAVATDNVDRTSTATATVSTDRTGPSITSRQLDKAAVIPNGADQLTVTIAAQDSSNPIWWIKGRVNFDGAADLATCQNNPPHPPCRGSFVWSTDQAYLVSSGYVSITACTGTGYGALIDAWGGSTYLSLASCAGSTAGNSATAALKIAIKPAFGEVTGNWISANAADVPGNIGAWGPTTPAAPLFDTLAPTPTTPQFSPVPPAFTKGTSINLQWTTSSEPVYGLKDYEAARTNTPAEAQACGASPPAGFTSSGAIGGTNHTFLGLADGQKYCYWVRARSNADKYSAWSTVASSTQDNTNPTCALSGVTGTAGIVYFNAPAKQVYYGNAGGGGSIDVTVSASDSESGITSVNFPSIGGFSGTGNDTTAPYRSSDVSAYAFTISTSFSGSTYVICTDGVNNQTPATYTVARDITAPDGGMISYPSGTFGAAAVTVTWDEGTDSGSGLGSVQIRRSEAAYSGGSCGVFGPFANAGSQSIGGVSWLDTNTQVNKCYRYEALVADNVGNTVTYDTTSVYIRIPGAPADPAKSNISALPQSIVADGASTSTITVSAIDTNNQNMGAGQAVVVSMEAGTGTLLGAVQDAGNGTYSQLLQSDTKPGSATLNATINGVLLNGRATVTYVVGPVDKDKTDVVAAPVSIVADGVSTSIVTVTPKDAGGNPLGKGQTVSVSLVSGTGTLTGAIMDKLDGTYEQTVTSPILAGSGEFEAEVNGVKVTRRATVTYTVGGAAKLAFSVQPPAAIQAGLVMPAFLVAVQDANGNVISLDNVTQVTLSLDTGTGTPQGTLTKTVSAGVATFDDVSHTRAETIRFRAKSAPPYAEGTSTDVVVSAGSADHVAAVARSASVLIGTQATLDIAVKDRYENTATGAREVTAAVDKAAQIVSSTLAGASGVGTATVTGTTAVDGTAEIKITDATPEIVTVSPDSAGLAGAAPNVMATVQFVRETPDHIVLAAPAGDIRAGVGRVITAKVRDKNDQELPAQAIVTLRAEKGARFTATTLGKASGVGTGVLSGTISAAGYADATVTDTVAEAVGINPEAQLPQVMSHKGVTLTFVPNVPAGTITLAPAPAKVRADGISATTVASGEIKDQYGNLQPDGTLVTVASSKGAILAPDASAANAGTQVAATNGVVAFELRSDVSPGVAEVTAATVEGSAAGATTVEFVTNGVPVANAGTDFEAVGGDTVTLDGSASNDPESDPLTFVWTQVSGDPVTLSDASIEKPEFPAPDVSETEELEFALVVNDGYGDSAPDTVKVTVVPGAGAAPKITSAPATKATTGEPYHYDTDDAAEASGRAPFVWSSVTAPAGFSIDAATGKISWTPVAYGDAGIAIKAENAWGSDIQTFTVTVGKGASPEPPTAVASVDKNSGDAPFVVSFDGSASRAGAGAAIVEFRWDFDDLTAASGQSATVAHAYKRPGVYRPALTVVDDWGQSASVSVEITVTERGKQPPSARIVADKTEGEAPLQVMFSAECADDGRITDYLWDFGDGSNGTVEKPAHIFERGGSWPVTLLVRDDDGLSGTDKVFITVTSGGKKPPAVKVSASVSSGEAPLSVDFSAMITNGDGEVSSRRWTIDGVDEGSSDTLSHKFADPGRYVVVFTVFDSNNLTASDSVSVSVLKDGKLPPKIVSTPTFNARAGMAYSYAAMAIGDPPIEWSVSAGPDGMLIDPTSGGLSWTPAADSPQNVDVAIVARNGGGEDDQSFTIVVGGTGGATDGGDADGGAIGGESAGGCSCSSAGGGQDVAGVLACIFLAVAAIGVLRRKEKRGW